MIYAGSIPAITCSVQQSNVAIPDNSDTGPAVPVTLRLFNAAQVISAQDSVTLALQ